MAGKARERGYVYLEPVAVPTSDREIMEEDLDLYGDLDPFFPVERTPSPCEGVSLDDEFVIPFSAHHCLLFMHAG